MPTNPGAWGIDLGQCALKALRLETIDGQVTATAFDYVEHPKILSQPDADPDQLIREAMEKFLSRNNLRGDSVAISVPGQSGLARFVKLPPVEEKKIVDIVRFEAKQQIPFNLDEVVWDYQKIGSGTVTGGFAMDTEIGLFAIKRDIINTALQHFKDVNVEVQVVQMAPLALANYVAYDLMQIGAGEEEEEGGRGKKECIVALDIGADSSNLVITDGHRIIWQRHLPLGGNHFTRALTKELKLTFAKAEHLKRNATKPVDKNVDLKKILGALKPVLNDFVGEVQRSLGYFTNTHRDAQVKYLMGLGSAFRLPGLQRFLSEKLQLEVRKLTKLERLSGDAVITKAAFSDNVLTFAVAYGLALQGLNIGRLHTNLLPPEIRTERLIRAKKPWAAAAAAALLVGLAGMGAGYAASYRAYGSKAVEDAIDQSKKVAALAKNEKSKYDEEVARADTEQKAVESVVAGSQERLDWMLLNTFIADSLPRPDPGPDRNHPYNLWSPGARSYVTEAARKAGAKLAERQAGPPGAATDDTGLDALIQCNIEAIDSRYASDLAAYWTAVKARPEYEVANLRPDWQKTTAPDGPGWVIELRGFTYNQGKTAFILNTLVDNLAIRGITTPPPAPGANGAAPGAPTAPTAAAPAAPGAVAAKPEESKNEGPVINKISHVLLFKAETNPSASLVSNGVLASLVTNAPAAAGGDTGGAGGMQPAMPGSGGGMMPTGGPAGLPGGAGGQGGGWTSLLSGGGGNAAGGGGGMLPPGRGSAPLMPSSGGGGGGGGGRPANDNQGASTTGRERTEFIVLFCWKEPNPSDRLMSQGDDTSGGAATSPGVGTPPMGGMMPGSGMGRP